MLERVGGFCSALDLPEEQARVGAAKAKPFGDRHVELVLPRNVGNHVDGASGVLVVHVDGGRQEGMGHRKNSEDRFRAPCRAEHVPGHRLRRGDRRWFRFGAEHGPDGDRKSTRLNSSHPSISYAVFCLKKKKTINKHNIFSKKKKKQKNKKK